MHYENQLYYQRFVSLNTKCQQKQIFHKKIISKPVKSWNMMITNEKWIAVKTKKRIVVWFGLLSLFNGISNFLGYLMPKPFSLKNSHHHHVVPLAWISLTLSRPFSLSFIDSGRFSGLHPISSHRCYIYIRAGRPAFARPYVGGP